MDVVESPLNLAHQQGRRADTFLKKEKFEEAIGCHKRAADLLLAAMRTTHTQGALQSLTLQREYHLKQEAIIRQKQRHAAIAQKKSKKPHIPSGSLDRTDGCIPNSDSMDHDVQFATQIANHLADNMEQGADGTLVLNTMEECDSLLQMLDQRNNETTRTNAGCGTRQNGEAEGAAQQQTNGTKAPKDEKVVIEELRVHNIALCGHIVDLLKEIDYHRRQMQHFRRENGELKEKLDRMEPPCMEDSTDSEKYYPVPIGMNLHDLPSLELPPLEMPKFDFSALNIDSEDSQDP